MPRPSLGLKRTQYFEHPSVLSALQFLAKKRQKTVAELTRAAVLEYVKRELKIERDDQSPLPN